MVTVSERDLRYVEVRVAETEINLYTHFLLATAELVFMFHSSVSLISEVRLFFMEEETDTHFVKTERKLVELFALLIRKLSLQPCLSHHKQKACTCFFLHGNIS